MDPASISIGITTWNQRELLRACLESIFRHPPESRFEVIVVDNASADGTAEMVRARTQLRTDLAFHRDSPPRVATRPSRLWAILASTNGRPCRM